MCFKCILNIGGTTHLQVYPSFKFKSGVSVKLRSSHNEFQEAMSAKISILRLV